MSGELQPNVEQSTDGDYLLNWAGVFNNAAVAVYASHSPALLTGIEPVLTAEISPVRISLPRGQHRWYFHLRSGNGPVVTVAERQIPLEGGTNFRDLGGYPTADGRRVRWGRLYRSGHTSALSPQDQALLETLGIDVCCDFRRQEEHRIEPTRLPAATRIEWLSINPGSASNYFEHLSLGKATPQHTASFMEEVNSELVLQNAPKFRRMFELLMSNREGGFMINCAAGKDRTGFGAAMILAALGVSRDWIVADYLLSQRYFPIDRELDRVIRKYGALANGNLTPEIIRPMMETRREYLEAAFAAIAENYASLGDYLSSALGMGAKECSELQSRYTE